MAPAASSKELSATSLRCPTRLGAPWTGPARGAGRRSGFFRFLEDLDAAAAGFDARAGSRPPDESIVAPATVARWELVGLLAPLTEADLDADPGGGESPKRATPRSCGHWRRLVPI